MKFDGRKSNFTVRVEEDPVKPIYSTVKLTLVSLQIPYLMEVFPETLPTELDICLVIANVMPIAYLRQYR
jgi:hypothetical protein